MKTWKRWEAGVSTLLLLLWCGLRIEAQPVIYKATGSREQIQLTIDQFKHDIIYGIGGDAQHPPSVLGSFRVATFDDVNVGSDNTYVSIGAGSSDGLQFPVLP